ncbi:hypothetical protein BFX06_05015 [Sulfobacillus thermosulfidooxidans]|nr:hypothetical protein BFX05_05235 [Sulfobacillus thermosulfidooxidans]OLZ14962.1 hypothetical protein BFX06_05015 [Sulfobacillus thermosulfidooxidans]OLZ19679.1 hypothetical protein BFX07_03195 [Sulfobacillus thermosulfidooxidans]
MAPDYFQSGIFLFPDSEREIIMSVERIQSQSWILPITSSDWLEEHHLFNLTPHHFRKLTAPEFTIAVVNRHNRLIGTIGCREVLQELLDTGSQVTQSLWPPFTSVEESEWSWMKRIQNFTPIPAGLLMRPAPPILTPPWDLWRAASLLTMTSHDVLWAVDECKVPQGKITIGSLQYHPEWNMLT